MIDWCPFAMQRLSPNSVPRLDGVVISATVLHIMDGRFDGSIDWLCDPDSGVSAHFGIAKNGRLIQMVPLSHSAYTNGLKYDKGRWYNPGGKRVLPKWSGLIPGINPIHQTITIEHEGKSGDAVTTAMHTTLIRLLQWLKGETGLIYQSDKTLIRHSDIDPVGKSYCPGPGFDLAAIATAANRDPDLDLWGDAVIYNKGWRIPTTWRDHKAQLGRALDTPFDAQGATWQRFAGGLIEYTHATKTTRVYLAEKKP